MSVLASLLLSVSLALQPEAALRVYNPHAAAVDATIDCAGTLHQVRVEAGDTKDIAPCATAAIEAPLPLTAFETMHEDGVETQRLLGSNAACEAFAVQAPLFGCRLGTASVAVPQVHEAAYAWSVEGASVVSGDGTNRLTLTLGEGTSARVSVTVTGECTATAEAVISLRAPLVITTFDVPAAATANAETTLEWSYGDGLTPASQLLSGEAFDAPVVLGGDVRSYKWIPKTTGSKTVELRASYSPAISLGPKRRRRATGSTRAAAAECPSALASARVEVGGCGTLNANIDAPEDVEAGSTFTAAIFLRTGETVKWTVEGGTILSGDTSDTVTVKAGDLPGNIELFALVTAGPGCQETAEARVDVIERAVCNTAPPAAALAVESIGCSSAKIRATFTGTPPFSGTWSDGASFRTSDATITHEFKGPATYTIQNFRDALCAGEVSKTARVTGFGPTASVAVIGASCDPGAKAVATFTGQPPFTGKWLGGEWFTTSETSVEITEFLAGVAQIEYIRDAQCPNSMNSSNAIPIERRPTARLRSDQYCKTGFQWYAHLEVDVLTTVGVRPPFTVYWSDGAVTQGGPNDFTVRRMAQPDEDGTEYSIVRVAGRTCDAIIDPDRNSAIVSVRPTPQIDHDTSDIVTCAGVPQKIRVQPGYHPSAQLEWSVDKGTIVSGQGTPEVTILQDRRPGGKVTLKATYPDRADCVDYPDTAQTYVYTDPEILDFSIQPATIPPGGTAQIHYRISDQVEWGSMGAFPKNRESDFNITQSDCTDIYGRNCTLVYKDTHGPGQVALTFSVGNECKSVERTVVLEIK